MRRAVSVAAALAIAFALSATLSAKRVTTSHMKDLSDIQALLAHPIIGPDQAEADAQQFCLKRVPDMPKVSSTAEWERVSAKMRRDVLDKVVFRGAAARRWRDYKARVEWQETIPGGPGYHIRKVRYEAVPGLWIPALLYEPDNLKGKAAVALHVNGHDSLGKAAPYKQIRSINLAKRGMIVLNVEWLGMGQLAPMPHYAMNQIDLCGSSGVAVFYLAMRRGLDLLLKHPNADKKRVAVSGLSGGGWQTIFLSSLDERVTLSNPVAGYSSFKTRSVVQRDLGDSEQTPNDLATVADYAHLTAMRAPRPTLLTFNANDNCCFRPDTGMGPLMDAALPIYRLYGKEGSLETHINYDPGTHNFEKDNREALYRFIGKHFFPDDKNYDGKEISSDSEVKTPEQLKIDLPADNATLHSLALQVMKGTRANRPGDSTDIPHDWVRDNRTALRKLLRTPDPSAYRPTAEKVGEELRGGAQGVFWKVKIGEWTLPVTEVTRAGTTPTGTAILLGDEGRGALAAQAEKLLAAGQRVLAVDPFYVGECKTKFGAGFLYSLLMAAVGERTLGIQSSQIGAVERWATGQWSGTTVALVSEGPRTGLITLTTAALDPGSFAGVTNVGGLKSLEEVVEKDWTIDRYPELFCFGMLEKTDIDVLQGLSRRK